MAFAMIDFDEEDHKKITIGNLIMIEELEKIKAEVNNIPNWCNPRMVKNDFITLLNSHISELKGNNE